MESLYPMRINKYLAHKKYCTRREADEHIERGRVLINGKKAKLGDKVQESDTVTVDFPKTDHQYLAYFKPRGVITHSAQKGIDPGEQEIKEIMPVPGVFPVGRLDKDSFGLIILTDDGRLTDALLNPEHEHEKEYDVVLAAKPPSYFAKKLEAGIDIGGYVTKKCSVVKRGDRKFTITITEGKKHQIRRMCGAVGQSTVELKRTRILNVQLGALKSNQYRKITGPELKKFLGSLGLA
ncbi:MAG: rRNA pseudouridine synthase [Candidatus Pacebacteria bacterium]|nr:rRNA pseudouridine synthase [Candidatus Paceibacterota bacterium]